MASLKPVFRNRNWKVRWVQVINHFLVIYLLFSQPLSIPLLMGSIFVWFLMFCIGVDIGVHRYFSHKSFKTDYAREIIMLFFFNIATIGSSLAWVGMHREHHAFSDTENDPHTPITDGTVTQQIIKSLCVYLGVWKKYIAHPKYIGNLRRQSLHKFAHNYYFLVILIYAGLLALIDFSACIYLYCLPAVLVFHSASFIVVYGHHFGKKTFDTNDHSRDSILLHWITWGEGLHNHHHAYPSRHRHRQVPWYMFDLPGFLIDFLFSISKAK